MPVIGQQQYIPAVLIASVVFIYLAYSAEHGYALDPVPVNSVSYFHCLHIFLLSDIIFNLVSTNLIFVLIHLFILPVSVQKNILLPFRSFFSSLFTSQMLRNDP